MNSEDKIVKNLPSTTYLHFVWTLDDLNKQNFTIGLETGSEDMIFNCFWINQF